VAAPPHAGLKAQQGEASGISSPVFTSFSARASDLQPTTRFALLLELWVLGPRVSGLCDQAVGHPCVRGGCGGTSLAGTISCGLAPCRFFFFFFLKRFAPGVGLVGGTGGQPALAAISESSFVSTAIYHLFLLLDWCKSPDGD
jgi:hypothetical protein